MGTAAILRNPVPARALAREIGDFVGLTKPRVTALVVLTAATGVYLASQDLFRWGLLFHVMIGTGLLSGGTAVLNQYMERVSDAKMRRTAHRPVPAGRIHPISALIFGMALVTVGTFYLLATTNGLTAILGWSTSAVYLLAYTPLKPRSSVCTLIGAIPGAVPPMMGWAAVTGSLDLDAWVLFGILFAWQFPHFLAIAWLYKEDYERGGLRMLPPHDSQGVRTSRRMFLFSVLLLGLSLIPYFSGVSGSGYLAGAVLLGLMFTASGLKIVLSPSKPAARLVLKASVLYLPLLLALMSLNKL